jgi:hypothetical protein
VANGLSGRELGKKAPQNQANKQQNPTFTVLNSPLPERE